MNKTMKEIIKKLKYIAKKPIINGDIEDNILNDDEAKEILEEIKRLNNIIKRLDNYVIGEQISEYGDTMKEAKNYLQRLKGGK